MKEKYIYIIKNLAPWMLDELIAFSQTTFFDIVFLRPQKDFYADGLSQIKNNGVKIYIKPTSKNNFFKKLLLISRFFLSNISNFSFDYNGVIGLKSIYWFLRMDLSIFSSDSNIHAQFATQASIIALLIKIYFKNIPEYSFTFHAYDIYFSNKWFSLLVKNCNKAFSISQFNIDYVKRKYINSDNIILSRLGVFRDNNVKIKKNNKHESFTLGLMSWFIDKKGIRYLLEAIKQLSDINIKLILAGDGPLKPDILTFIKVNNLNNKVKYIGKIKGEQKKNFLESLDTFILPAITIPNDMDGIPVVLMEAISYGLPIISTNVSGIPEICINDYNGLLIQEKNVSEIKETIKKLYNDKLLKENFSFNALELSNEYDIVKNSKQKLLMMNWNEKQA